MKKGFSKILPLILGFGMVLVGVSLSISPVVEFSKRNFLGWKKVPAEIVGFNKRTNSSGNIEFISVVDYKIDENINEVLISAGETAPQIGQHTTIYYDPQNPSEFAYDDLPILNLIVLIIPISGVILMIFSISNFKKRQKLEKFETEEQNEAIVSRIKNSGTKIFGEIIDVEVSNSPNGASVGRAVIRAKFAGREQIFRSGSIEGLTPGLLVSYLANPMPVSILISGNDTEDYYVESEEILEVIKKSFETVREVNLTKERNV